MIVFSGLQRHLNLNLCIYKSLLSTILGNLNLKSDICTLIAPATTFPNSFRETI